MTDEAAIVEAGTAFSESELDASGFRVRYWCAGEGNALVVLHGAGGVGFNGGLDLLTHTNKIYAIELPGFGETVNNSTQDAADMAIVVNDIVDALGLSTFALLGTSMGGVVASWYAVKYQERLTRLILEAPGAFRPDRDPSKMDAEEQSAAFHAHPERKVLRKPDLQRMRQVWPLVERLMGPPFDQELADCLVAVTVPTLVMYGSADGLFGTAPGSVFKQLIPSATFSIVYDAAHDIAGDRPQAFAGLVGEFIERGPNFAIQNKSSLIYP